jgi:hypothetical protein
LLQNVPLENQRKSGGMKLNGTLQLLVCAAEVNLLDDINKNTEAPLEAVSKHRKLSVRLCLIARMWGNS